MTSLFIAKHKSLFLFCFIIWHKTIAALTQNTSLYTVLYGRIRSIKVNRVKIENAHTSYCTAHKEVAKTLRGLVNKLWHTHIHWHVFSIITTFSQGNVFSNKCVHTDQYTFYYIIIQLIFSLIDISVFKSPYSKLILLLGKNDLTYHCFIYLTSFK